MVLPHDADKVILKQGLLVKAFGQLTEEAGDRQVALGLPSWHGKK